MSRPKKRKSRRRRAPVPPAAVPRRDGPARGLAYMLVAGLLFAFMGAAVYAAALAEPPVAAPMVSFVRVALNLSILLVPAVLMRRVAGLFGDLRPSLWWRGMFGGVSLILSFAAIQRIGPGESAFLSASSGVFVAALGPYVLGQRNSWGVWLAIWGAWLGLFLLFQPGMGQGDWQGRALGLASGFLAALAYLMVARAGSSNPPGTVVFYFCLVATLIHLAWFAVEGVALPSGFQAWGWAVLAGLAGSAAQWFMTRAYQLAPAALVGAVGYVGPVLSLALGALWFGKVPGNEALAGCGLVLLCGVYCGSTTLSPRRAE